MERVVILMGFVFIFLLLFLSWGGGEWWWLVLSLCERCLVWFGDVEMEMEMEIEIDMYNVKRDASHLVVRFMRIIWGGGKSRTAKIVSWSVRERIRAQRGRGGLGACPHEYENRSVEVEKSCCWNLDVVSRGWRIGLGVPVYCVCLKSCDMYGEYCRVCLDLHDWELSTCTILLA